MKSEGTVPYNGILSIKEIISHLEFLKNREKSSVLIDTMTKAISLLGRCVSCMGTGEEENFTKPTSGYKVKYSPRGARIYVMPCTTCHGSGKQLDVTCISCGQSAALRPEQRQLSYCHECETRLRMKGSIK